MEKQEDIVKLVKSLSKTEKRYFKLFIAKNSVGESSHYLNLFDLIDKAGSAEKKVIQMLHPDKSFMQKQFRVYKHLLYKQILKSLSSYHLERSIDDKLMELIRQVKILYDKTLYINAVKILKKAKNVAYKYEKDLHMLQIIHWQKKIANASGFNQKIEEKDFIQLFEEEKLINNRIKDTNASWKLYSLLFHTYRINGIARTKEDMEIYNAIIRGFFLEKLEFSMSYLLKRDFHTISSLYYTAVNNTNKAYVNAKRLVALMEANPHQIEEEPGRYSGALHNFLFSTKELRKYDEFFHTLPKLKSILQNVETVMSEKVRLSVLLSSYNLEFEVLVEIGQFKKAEHMLPEFEEILKNQKNRYSRQEIFARNNIVLLYFGRGNYNKALNKLNETLNDKEIYYDLDHYSFSRVFQLIIHFEKGNMDLLPYLVKSLYRYLMQRKKLYPAENVFIQFIRTRLINIKNDQDRMEAFKELREELIRIYNDPAEEKFLKAFDFISWLESKIENRPFESILREKSGFTL